MNDIEYTNNQEGVNTIWRNVWERQAEVPNIGKIFHNQLFIKAYPVIKKYIPTEKILFLEVGTGTGRYGLGLARDLPESRFLLTDILEESLMVSKKLSHHLSLSNVEFIQADIFNLPFENDTFDVVFSDAVIQHLVDYPTAFKSLVRVLKSGGTLIVAGNNFWNIHTMFKKIQGKRYSYGFEKSFKIRELEDLAQRSNCKVIATDGFFVAYGLSRYRPGWVKLLAKMLDGVVNILDSLSNRYISKKFGFEILIVAQKL